MQTFFKTLIGGFLITITLFSCSEDDSVFGPEYEINDFNVSIYESDYYRDTIPASIFKIKLTYLSDNEYAFDYGLSPQLNSDITDLSIRLIEGGIKGIFEAPMDVSHYFLVLDNDYAYSTGLYQTLDQYIEKEDINTLTPYLIFTNQVSLSPSSKELISDTVKVTLEISLTLDNTNTITKQVKTVIRP